MPAGHERQIEDLISEICAALSQEAIVTAFTCVVKRGSGARENHWIDGFSPCSFKRKMTSILDPSSDAGIAVDILVCHSERSIICEGVATLPKQIERGLTGLMLRRAGQTIRISPTTMLTDNMSFPEALKTLVRNIPTPEEIADIEQSAIEPDIRSFSTVQFLIPSFNSDTNLQRVFRGKPVVSIEDVSSLRLDTLALSLSHWMAKHVSENGRLTYCYHPGKNFCAANTNRIREFMGSIALFKAARHFNDKKILSLAELNLKHNIAEYYRDEMDYGVIVEGEKIKLGAIAMAAVAIRKSGWSNARYDQCLHRLTKLTEMMWRESGEFHTFLRPIHLDGKCQNFYPGETLLFWAERWVESKDRTLWKKIEASFRYYRNWHRTHKNPAFIPWHTQAYALLWRATGDDRFLQVILEMNDWLLPFQQWESITDYPDAQGRFYDPAKPLYGPPHASSTGVYLEGLVDALDIAMQVEDSGRAYRYGTAIKRGLRNIIQLHYSAPCEVAGFPDEEKALGGIRTTEYNNIIRVDNVQHNLMAILKILQMKNFPWEMARSLNDIPC